MGFIKSTAFYRPDCTRTPQSGSGHRTSKEILAKALKAGAERVTYYTDDTSGKERGGERSACLRYLTEAEAKALAKQT